MRRLALALLLLVVGCADSGDLGGDAIDPGTGITVAGSTIRIGDAAAVASRLGAAKQVRDMGPAGVHHRYAQRNLVVVISATDATVSGFRLLPGFTGLTPEGVGLDSEEAAVQAAYGAPTRDPFLGTWVYPTLGLIFEMEAGKVARISLGAAQQ